MRRKGENGEQSKGLKVPSVAALKVAEKEERESLVLWKRPFMTFNYFIRELFIYLQSYGRRLLDFKWTLLSIVVLIMCWWLAAHVQGPHLVYLELMKKKTLWSLYWVGLGVLSSIGLGTGLHTFLLYLGPHIAGVTLAAYECGGLNFPEPPYPDDIICPQEVDPSWTASMWNIVKKVHLEAIMWGAGTALGELPPYFMARASRLSGTDPDDEDEELQEFEELQRKIDHPETLSTLDKAKLMVENLVNKVGFFGILLCASIPNPLFDLAGLTCGHFLVPFWTFFGATLIGKACIKMMIQAMFVIIAFSDVLIGSVMSFLSSVPAVGTTLQGMIQSILQMQRERLHRDSQSSQEHSTNPLSTIFEVFVISMVAYFLLSIVNSLAQSHHKRLHKKNQGKNNWKD